MICILKRGCVARNMFYEISTVLTFNSVIQVAALEISMIKVAAPNMAARVIDRAIQVHNTYNVASEIKQTEQYVHRRNKR